jgi:hypothetical protein
MRKVSIFGATGSIGQNTIDLIKRAPDEYDVVALTGARNIKQLAQDARDLHAKVAVTADPKLLPDLRAALAGSGVEVAAGPEALIEAATRPADWVMSAIVGAAGLAPGLKALEQGASLALANKESMVCAGALVKATAKQFGGRVLPVDSEHSAVFQGLIGEKMEAVERIIITASGGAFRDWPMEKLASATPAQAATHPNWDMGQRITIDSASMFNKALEVIETREFFVVSSISQIKSVNSYPPVLYPGGSGLFHADIESFDSNSWLRWTLDGENIAETVKRELKEELDIDHFKMIECMGAEPFYREEKNKAVCVIMYIIELPDFTIKLSEEHDDYMWATAEDLNKLEYFFSGFPFWVKKALTQYKNK